MKNTIPDFDPLDFSSTPVPAAEASPGPAPGPATPPATRPTFSFGFRFDEPAIAARPTPSLFASSDPELSNGVLCYVSADDFAIFSPIAATPQSDPYHYVIPASVASAALTQGKPAGLRSDVAGPADADGPTPSLWSLSDGSSPEYAATPSGPLDIREHLPGEEVVDYAFAEFDAAALVAAIAHLRGSNRVLIGIPSNSKSTATRAVLACGKSVATIAIAPGSRLGEDGIPVAVGALHRIAETVQAFHVGICRSWHLPETSAIVVPQPDAVRSEDPSDPVTEARRVVEDAKAQIDAVVSRKTKPKKTKKEKPDHAENPESPAPVSRPGRRPRVPR